MRTLLLALFLPALALAAPKWVTVSGETATLRSGPNEKAPTVATAPRGTVFEFDSANGDWVKVRTGTGTVGFVLRKELVPGKKKLEELPPLPGKGGGATATASPTPKPASGDAGTGKSGPKTDSVAKRPPPPPPEDDGPPPTADFGGPRESRKGLAVRVGPVIATSSYSLDGGSSRRHSGTRYIGAALDVDYWLLNVAGAHLRVASGQGSTDTRVSASTSVTGIAAQLQEIQLDLLGRYIIGSRPTSPAVVGLLGFHMEQVTVDSVEIDDQSVGPVGQSYAGPVVGLGAEVPLGSPAAGVHGRVEYWPGVAVTEPDEATGTPDGASGMGFAVGGYAGLTRKLRLEATLEMRTFDVAYEGDGFRYGEPVRDATVTDRYTVFFLSAAYRF